MRGEQASDLARICSGEVTVREIDGFVCPGGENIGPQNLLQAHPIYPHPTDCRSYFSCYHNRVGAYQAFSPLTSSLLRNPTSSAAAKETFLMDLHR